MPSTGFEPAIPEIKRLPNISFETALPPRSAFDRFYVLLLSSSVMMVCSLESDGGERLSLLCNSAISNYTDCRITLL